MINLLPPEYRQNMLYARRNTRMLRWVMASLLVLTGIAAVNGFGYLYLEVSAKNYRAQVEQSRQELQAQRLEETLKDVESLSAEIDLVVKVLSRQILFSELLGQIGRVMPSDTVLTALKISDTKGGIDLDAEAAHHKAATQIQLNLQDEDNKIFEKADINSSDCESAGKTLPCVVSIRALFGDNSRYLFISPASGKDKGATQ